MDNEITKPENSASLGGRIDTVVRTHESRTEVLESIAKSYLIELRHALEQAKISQLIGNLGPNETPTMLEVRVSDLQVRVDSVTYRLESVDAL